MVQYLQKNMFHNFSFLSFYNAQFELEKNTGVRFFAAVNWTVFNKNEKS